jgi:hypothetical protein
MALIEVNKDGTYESECALCGRPLTKPIFATSHFMSDESHDLYRFSDAGMHWDCYARWPHQERFASMYFESWLKVFETGSWLQYWAILWKCDDAMVQYGVSVNKILITLRRTGTDIGIPREKWQSWLGGGWRESCRHPLESQAVGELLSELGKLSLPEPDDLAGSAVS